jgi:hypothetical protein
MVEKAWKQNDHGGGVAWRESGIVKWKKDLTFTEMQDHVKGMPLPYIAHFRIASQGGRAPSLCHPFEVSKTTTDRLSGRSKTGVVFHNGTWGTWRNTIMEAAIRTGLKLPDGPWSDTRAMAFLTSIYGEAILDIINEKTVLFGPRTIKIFGEGWEEEDDITMSNTIFLKNFSQTSRSTYNHAHNYSGRGGSSSVHGDVGTIEPGKEIVRVITAEERAKGGTSLDITFRGSFNTSRPGENQQEKVEANSEQVLETTVTTDPAAQHAIDSLTPEEKMVLRHWGGKSGRVFGVSNGNVTSVVQEEAELHRRIDMARKGIVYLGRM